MMTSLALGCVAIAAVCGGVWCAWRDRADLLITGYLVAAMFSGVKNSRLDHAFVALRLLGVVLIAVAGLRKPTRSGAALALLGVSALWLLAVAAKPSISPTGLLLGIGLLLAVIPFGWAVARSVSTEEGLRRVLRAVILASGIFVALSFAGLGGRLPGQHRFAGSVESPSLFAITGGLLVPVLTWGMLYTRGRLRVFASCSLPIVAAFTVLSGQRAGVIAAAIGVAPFAVLGILRGQLRWLVAAIPIGGVGIWVAHTPAFAFALSRLPSLDANGRTIRWHDGIHQILASPVTGHGPGTFIPSAAASTLNYGLHNSFLAAGYEGGLFALGLWILAMVIGTVAAGRLALSRRWAPTGIPFLLLGLMLALIAVALVEDKLYSPTNFAMFLLIVTLTATHRMWRQDRGTYGKAEQAAVGRSHVGWALTTER